MDLEFGEQFSTTPYCFNDSVESYSRKLSSKNCLLAIPDLKIHVYETLFCCKNFTVKCNLQALLHK